MKHFLAGLRIFIGLSLFIFVWYLFIDNGARISFTIIIYLIYCSYLILGGWVVYSSLNKRVMMTKELRWLGALCGIFIAINWFFNIYMIGFAILAMALSIYEIVLLTKKSAPTKDEVADP